MKEVLIALCAFLAARVVITAEYPNAPHLLGGNECTWGPSYWCENITTAAGCNATKHCIQTMWKDMKVPEDNDSVCGICKDMVQQARDQLQSNQTMVELRDVFEGSCKLMHIKAIVKECITLVNQFIPELAEMLTSQMNPSVVCSVVVLCNSDHIDKLLLEYEQSKTKNQSHWPLLSTNAREIGVRILKNANKNMKNETEEDLSESEVEAMQLPIEKLVPFPISQSQPNVEGKQSCALCDYVLRYTQDTITHPITENRVKQALAEVCKILPPAITGECTEFVDTYRDAIVTILAQEIDTVQVCRMLHVCPSQQLMELWHAIPKEYVLKEEVENKPSCPLCLLAVSQLYNVIKDNKTEARIEAELDQLCDHLPRSLTDTCADFVKGYSKELVEMLLAGLAPQEVCVYIQLCNALNHVDPKDMFVTDFNDGIRKLLF